MRSLALSLQAGRPRRRALERFPPPPGTLPGPRSVKVAAPRQRLAQDHRASRETRWREPGTSEANPALSTTPYPEAPRAFLAHPIL